MKLEDYIEAEESKHSYTRILLWILAIIFLFFVWFLFTGSKYKHAIYMDSEKLNPDRVSDMKREEFYTFKYGEDFFVYYKKGWSTPQKINIKLFLSGKEKKLILDETRRFKQDAKKMQLFFDEHYFESPGEYLIEFRNEDNEILSTQKFKLE